MNPSKIASVLVKTARVKEWGLLASALKTPRMLENRDTQSQEGYSTAPATAMAMFSPNTISLRRRPMRLQSKATQQLSGWRKQSTYRSSGLNPIDLLFKSSTWVQSYKTQVRKEPFLVRTVSPDTSWTILISKSQHQTLGWHGKQVLEMPGNFLVKQPWIQIFTNTSRTQWKLQIFSYSSVKMTKKSRKSEKI